uniref:L-threonine 3-dehydrogenase, mitochondrial n=1 Tax=Acrobeloides nanus TaxID=290746 RepID=A0A914DZN2_9BILA
MKKAVEKICVPVARSRSRTPVATYSSQYRRTASPPRDQYLRYYEIARKTEKKPKILITGGLGQLGRSLASIYKFMYGEDSVILSDICKRPENVTELAPFQYLNIMDRNAIEEAIVNNNVDTIIHFSALLSAIGEANVPLALQVNCQGVQNVLEVSRIHRLKVFIPSTIGAFGPTTPRVSTPDLTIQRPRTIYGVTKVFAELLGEYYFEKYGVDFRSLRFPGIISDVQPGGGTTDYAIQIFYDALKYGKHKCYLRHDTALPMMYNDDCMASVINFLSTPSTKLSMRTYNVTGISFTPAQIAEAIQRVIPHFQIEYDICPIRQKIADTWPQSLDDSTARQDWNWSPEYDLDQTVNIMFKLLSKKLNIPLPFESYKEEPRTKVLESLEQNVSPAFITSLAESTPKVATL